MDADGRRRDSIKIKKAIKKAERVVSVYFDRAMKDKL